MLKPIVPGPRVAVASLTSGENRDKSLGNDGGAEREEEEVEEEKGGTC